MSKSKGNVVSPDELIAEYGADTVRLYTLFIGPPEKDAEWNDRAVEGAWRFLNRVWNKIAPHEKDFAAVPRKRAILSELSPAEEELYRKVHQTIRKITEDIEERFHFNTAISAIMELVNLVYRYILRSGYTGDEPEEQVARFNLFREVVETTVILLAPFVPHIAEELWQKLGHEDSIFKEKWPTYDDEAFHAEEIVVVVQVNGKVRSRLTVPADISDEELKKRARADERISKLTVDRKIKKVVTVPRKLINIVLEE